MDLSQGTASTVAEYTVVQLPIKEAANEEDCRGSAGVGIGLLKHMQKVPRDSFSRWDGQPWLLPVGKERAAACSAR